jgi:uncharacterized coiled-coil protein SlyX
MPPLRQVKPPAKKAAPALKTAPKTAPRRAAPSKAAPAATSVARRVTELEKRVDELEKELGEAKATFDELMGQIRRAQFQAALQRPDVQEHLVQLLTSAAAKPASAAPVAPALSPDIQERLRAALLQQQKLGMSNNGK